MEGEKMERWRWKKSENGSGGGWMREGVGGD